MHRLQSSAQYIVFWAEGEYSAHHRTNTACYISGDDRLSINLTLHTYVDILLNACALPTCVHVSSWRKDSIARFVITRICTACMIAIIAIAANFVANGFRIGPIAGRTVIMGARVSEWMM